ncbi:MAG: hypothetical protein IKA99_08125 [Clostridia bacterium]|nr:hypothetical protein [Clostridia bacterium]
MFDFLKSDNVPNFEITGVAIGSCQYTCRIRDDFKLLLSQNVKYERAIDQILDYYTNIIRQFLTDYEYAYYLPLTYIVLAYYSAKNGYYNKKLFDNAINLIDRETTLFIWKDAILFEKNNCNTFKTFIESSFKENAYKVAEILINTSLPKEIFETDVDIPKSITQILFIDGSASKKYEKRKIELLKVKDLLKQKNTCPKKQSASSILGKISDYKFSTDYIEGDVLAYQLKSNKFKGKYIILVVDYIREKRKILCDFSNLIEKWEYFAIVDGLYDAIPKEIPYKYRATGIKKDINDKSQLMNHRYLSTKTPNLEFVKISTISMIS